MNIKFLFHRCREQLKESQYVERDIGEFYMNFYPPSVMYLWKHCICFFLDYVISELCMLRKNGPVGRSKHVNFSEYVVNCCWFKLCKFYLVLRWEILFIKNIMKYRAGFKIGSRTRMYSHTLCWFALYYTPTLFLSKKSFDL